MGVIFMTVYFLIVPNSHTILLYSVETQQGYDHNLDNIKRICEIKGSIISQ